jgi:hypothetical protein
MPQPPTPPPTALTAASVKDVDQRRRVENWRFGDQAWQMEAWRMYDIIGELRKYANWIGAAVAQVPPVRGRDRRERRSVQRG